MLHQLCGAGAADLPRLGRFEIIVLNYAGYNGVWEDIAGRKGDIRTVRKLPAISSAIVRVYRELSPRGICPARCRLMAYARLINTEPI